MSMKKPKRYADGGDIPQTDEEAANEAALNADLPRRRMMDAGMAEGARDEKAMGKGESASESASESAKATKPAKSSVVTKEELAKSGLSLRDYMNKQRGLTRRGESAPAKKPEAPAKKPEAVAKKSEAKYETPYDRMNRQNKEAAASTKRYDRAADVAAISRSMKEGPKSETNSKTLFPGARYKNGGKVVKMANGGSVSSASKRGDGIAQKGKTKCRVC